MKTEIVIKELSQLTIAAQQFLDAIKGRSLICFDAPMGSGKTTFINALLKEMNCGELGSSPTYSIVNEYLSPTYGRIFHLDLYRLKSLEEALDIGIEDILYDASLCFIEWPDIISNLLPDSHVWVKIVVNDENHRIISFEL